MRAVCRDCEEELGRVGDLWVTLRSGDDGGTYDLCTESDDEDHHPSGATDDAERVIPGHYRGVASADYRWPSP
jgi:hypothetical protein